MNLRQIQRTAHLVSRAAGDLNAAKRGPDVLAKRLVRREVTRRAFALLRRAFALLRRGGIR